MGVPEPGIMMGTRLYTIPGYLIIEEDGRRSSLAIADLLRAADIPALTYEQVDAIKTLANMFAVLYRTLVAKEVIGEDLLEEGEYDLNVVMQVIEDMGGDYGEPDLTVT